MPSPEPAGDLRRVIGFWGGVAIVVGTTIGSGIFRKPATIAKLIHDPAVILGLWTAFGAIILCGALALAELASLLPRTGGIYVYLRAAYGDASAFVLGWLYLLVTIPAAIGALAMFFGELVIDLLGGSPRWIPAIAIATTALLAAANVRGVRPGSVIQELSTVIKVAALAAVVAGAFVLGRGDFGHLRAPAGTSFDGAALTGVALALSSFMWSHSGWQAFSMVAGEVAEPERFVKRILISGTLAIILLYVGANVAYLYVFPIEAIAAEPSIATRLMSKVAGPAGGTLLAIGIMASVLGALNGQILAKTRVPYALARDGLTFGVLGRCHPRWSTPYVAILVPAAVAILLVLWLKDFDRITTYFAVVEWAALIFAVGAVLVLRRRMPAAPRPFRTPAYPWVPLAFVVGATIGLAAILWAEWRKGNYAPHLGLAIALAGFPVHRLWRWRAGPGPTSSP